MRKAFSIYVLSLGLLGSCSGMHIESYKGASLRAKRERSGHLQWAIAHTPPHVEAIFVVDHSRLDAKWYRNTPESVQQCNLEYAWQAINRRTGRREAVGMAWFGAGRRKIDDIHMHAIPWIVRVPQYLKDVSSMANHSALGDEGGASVWIESMNLLIEATNVDLLMDVLRDLRKSRCGSVSGQLTFLLDAAMSEPIVLFYLNAGHLRRAYAVDSDGCFAAYWLRSADNPSTLPWAFSLHPGLEIHYAHEPTWVRAWGLFDVSSLGHYRPIRSIRNVYWDISPGPLDVSPDMSTWRR